MNKPVSSRRLEGKSDINLIIYYQNVFLIIAIIIFYFHCFGYQEPGFIGVGPVGAAIKGALRSHAPLFEEHTSVTSAFLFRIKSYNRIVLFQFFKK